MFVCNTDSCLLLAHFVEKEKILIVIKNENSIKSKFSQRDCKLQRLSIVN